MGELPDGWALTTFEKISVDCDQRVPAADEEFKYVDIASVDRENKKVNEWQLLIGKNAPSRARKSIRCGDVLVSMTRPNLNAVALVNNELDGQIASTGFDVIRCLDIDPRWVFYIVRSKTFVEKMSALVQGALYPAVRSKDIRSYELPVPPLPEQKRIADKLDSVLARVDGCRERLDKIPLLIKRFRQSVLAAATSGWLTEDWRRKNSVREWKLSESLGSLGGVSGGLTKNSKRDGLSFQKPYLRVANVYANELRLDNIAYIGMTEQEFSRSKLEDGDLLIVEGNGSLDQIGRVAIWNDAVPGCSHQNHLIRWRAGLNILPKFALYFLLSPDGRSQIIKVASSTTGLHTLSISKVSTITIPIATLEEQHEIVRRVEILFAFADRLEARLSRARRQVEQLTPALLAKAFRGELVPQDPDDEPAAELLKRLAASRAAAPKAKRGRRPASDTSA